MPVMNDVQFFDASFKALTGHAPLPWQRRLFSTFLDKKIPDGVDLPTGLGKTSVIAIWLIALAAQTANGPPSLPRRLVYVVDRRTVVDQATDIAELMRARLRENGPGAGEGPLASVRAALSGLCVDPADDASPLAISTLRGEHADNREWQADPARAAIIVGTVDMIGSRLLFEGYGAGRSSRRALSAGLLGHDALVVHDEAHLSPAFSVLLDEVARAQCAANEPRPVRVTALSATRRGAWKSPRSAPAGDAFALTADEKRDAVVHQRLTAAKALRIEDVDASDDLPGRIAAAALAHRDSRARVLVFVSAPGVADLTRKEIEKGVDREKGSPVGLLTGVLRGHERDRLVAGGDGDPAGAVFQAFWAAEDRSPPPQTQYLVATSAGEVGIDLDADHMVSDLATLDSVIQRLGRVNRLGRADPDFVARIDVFAVRADTKGKKTGEMDERFSSYEAARRETRATLDRLPVREDGGHDASPAALRALVEELGPEVIERAFAPMPRVAPVTDILLDAWALTSVRGKLPGRPPVERWLHGVEAEIPETVVVWRAEAKDLAELPVGDDRWGEAIDEWFEAHPIFARERLRDRSDRVAKHIGAIAKRHPDAKALLLRRSNPPERVTLADAADKDAIGDAVLILPIEAGGFDPSTGMLDGKKDLPVDDVADLTTDAKQARLRVLLHRPEEGGWAIAPLGRRADGLAAAVGRVEASDGALNGLVKAILEKVNEGEGSNRFIEREPRLILAEAEEGPTRVLLSIGRSGRADTLYSASGAAEQRQTLDDHLEWAQGAAARIARRLGLDGHIASAIEIAMQRHDTGKARTSWQRAIGNRTPEHPWAKSGGRGFDRRACSGYRHEFGSLREAMVDPVIRDHPERDLILHLIAAHHGWARPHFEERHWDRGDQVNAARNAEGLSEEENAVAAAETMRRFPRLQRRFGRWGLAWLEVLAKAADAIASARAEGVEDLPA